MPRDMNVLPLEDGQTISAEALKAWMVCNTETSPLSSQWKCILEESGEIQADGWTYFFKAIERDHYSVRRFATEEVSDFHRNFYGGRLQSRMTRHFMLQNFIVILMAILIITMIVTTAITFTWKGVFIALCWCAALFVLWYGWRTLP